MDDLCEANGTFAISLFKILGEEDNSRNVFFSPMSISSALAMVFMGAKGSTAAQMSQVCVRVAKENGMFPCASVELSFCTFATADESLWSWRWKGERHGSGEEQKGVER